MRVSNKWRFEVVRHQVLAHTLAEQLGKHHYDIIYGKGGFWIRGKGFYTIAQARKLTGIKATPRNNRTVMLAWGDYATIAQINRIKA